MFKAETIIKKKKMGSIGGTGSIFNLKINIKDNWNPLKEISIDLS